MPVRVNRPETQQQLAIFPLAALVESMPSFTILPLMATDVLHPHQVVPRSGIYRVRHGSHRTAHLVTALKGERFPACRTCGLDVSFQLIEPADYVIDERDFRDLSQAS